MIRSFTSAKTESDSHALSFGILSVYTCEAYSYVLTSVAKFGLCYLNKSGSRESVRGGFRCHLLLDPEIARLSAGLPKFLSEG